MIFFDQRLRPLDSKDATYATTIAGNGSHLEFKTQAQSAIKQQKFNQKADCRLFAEYVLPKEYFFDAFELQNRFPNKTQLYGEQDLEAPTWKVSGWGSILYVDIEEAWATAAAISIPFHARYFEPSTKASPRRTRVMAPQLFQSCHQADQAFIDNPWETSTFKSQVLGEDQYYRFLQSRGAASFEITGAVADASHEGMVRWVSSTVILLGFVYSLTRMLLGRERRTAINARHEKMH